jgi:hypothetical protein
MPILTFYVYKTWAKNRRVPIQTIDYVPTDWLNLRELLTQVAIKVWFDFHMMESMISLERHLKGKFIVKYRPVGDYTPKKVFYKRNTEFFCRLSFDPHKKAIKVRTASFGPNMMDFLNDYRLMEKGQRWKTPPSCIPRAHQNLSSDPRSLCLEPSLSFHSTYDRTEKLTYGEQAFKEMENHLYDKPPSMTYLPKALQIQQEDESEPKE